MSIVLDLFFSFFKIGLFTFGGGYAMIAIIEDECVDKKKWITGDEMLDITVIAESTPGPIAVNCATFVGYKQKGFFGSLAATLGVILPSFIIIYLISMFLDNFMDITIVANAFKGIKVAVGIIIFDAAIKMISKMKKQPLQLVILAVSAVAMLVINIFSLHFSSVALMLIAGLVSLIIFSANGKLRKDGTV